MTYPGHRFALTAFAVVIIAWLVAMLALMRASALPPEATGTMLAVFPVSTSTDDAFASLTRAEARVIKRTALSFIWVVDGMAGSITREGALAAYRELPIPAEIAGCVAIAERALP